MSATSLDELLDLLHEIAPLELAAEWDNTGLLLRPFPDRTRVERCLLTIDLTEAVVAEATEFGADLVVAYHPPIFRPLSRLDAVDATQRRIVAALQAGFAVYSPHTALDAAAGGLCDWILSSIVGDDVPETVVACGEGEFGRHAELEQPTTWQAVLQRARQAFGVEHLQVARPQQAGDEVHSIAVAAGAGGGVLRGARADVWVTGEMSHHDVLAAVADGVSVVLAGHSNTERGFLRELGGRIADEFSDVQVRCSGRDADPLTVS